MFLFSFSRSRVFCFESLLMCSQNRGYFCDPADRLLLGTARFAVESAAAQVALIHKPGRTKKRPVIIFLMKPLHPNPRAPCFVFFFLLSRRPRRPHGQVVRLLESSRLCFLSTFCDDHPHLSVMNFTYCASERRFLLPVVVGSMEPPRGERGEGGR